MRTCLVAPSALLVLLLATLPARPAVPELVIQETTLRTIDTVELFRNGLYWWTSSSCSGEVVSPGGAAYLAYTDPRLLSANIPSFTSRPGTSGGFHSGDSFEPGLSLAALKTSALRGVLLPDCAYGAYFVRDDEAFYYTKARGLYRKSLTAPAFAGGEPIRFQVGLERFPISADGVLFVTDTEVWSYASDLAKNTITIHRTWKTGVRDVSRIREVLTMPGVSLRKFAIVDIQATDGSYLGSELILLAPNGNLYRAGVIGGTATLVRSGVNDFAVRHETYTARGNLGLTVKRRATTLYMAADNPFAPSSNGQLLGLDLNAGARGQFVEYTLGSNFRATSVAVDKNHIFLTRTPTSGLANSDLLGRNAPAEPTIANPGDPDYGVIAVAREFRSLRSTGRLVYFAHGNTVQRLSASAPPIDIDFEASGIEVTQAIQNMNNTVPLVAGRRVYVRGYARIAANNTGRPAFDVPAQLRVYHTPKLPIGQAPFTEVSGSPFLPTWQPAVSDVVSLQTQRTNLNATFQFEIPETVVTEGDLRFEFLLNPGYSVPETGINPLANNTSAATLSAKESIILPLTMVPVRFNGGFYDPNAPDSRFWDIIARARTLLPFAQFRIGIRSPGISKSIFGAPPRSFDLTTNDTSQAILQLEIARILDGNPLGGPYVGMAPPAAAPFNGIGQKSGQAQVIRMTGENGNGSWAPWNSLRGGITLAHEFCHNTGFRHFRNLGCGNVPLGSDGTTRVIPDNYDGYPSGADACTLGRTDLDDPATAVGFDPISWGVVPPGINGELMSYSTNRWISEYNWTRLYEIHTFRFPARASSLALHAPPPAGSFLIIQGSVNLTANTAVLSPAYTLPAAKLAPAILAELTSLPENLPANHPVRFQWLDHAGAVLAEYLAPLASHEDGETAEASLSRAIPMLDGARAIRLVHGATVLAQQPISAQPPVVALNPPALANGQLQLAWTATDADGDALQFTTQLSADDGQTWQTLTVNQSERDLSLDSTRLPGGAAMRVRTIATDGVRAAIATSDAFALPKHAPQVRITGVTHGQQIDFGEAVSVEGFGYDVEDGSLPDVALTWTLTGPEARQGAGHTLSLSNLAPGAYTLTLTGIDSDGQTSTHTIQFSMNSFTVADGAEPVLDGLCADAGYGGTPPIRFATANGRYANARFTHANGALFVCFTGLRYGAANTTGAVAGLRLDVGGSGQAVTTTVGFAVNENGEPLRVNGDGSKWVALTNPPPGFSAVILRDENTWSAEMRIEDALLGGWSNQLGLVALFDEGNATTPPETWPPNADIDQPSSWATSRPAPRPPQELIVNGSFENLEGTFVRDTSGLMSLPSGSSAIPGWTTASAALVWVDNTNAFGARTPFGSHSLDLTGYHDGHPYGGVTQTIATKPGQTYRLSLALGSNADYIGAGFPKSIFVCAGSTGRVLNFFPTNPTGNLWETFMFHFTAEAPSTVITLDGGRLSGNYLGIDNVSVIAEDSTPASGPANLVVNGSFETFVCPGGFAPDGNGVMSLPQGATVISGWTTTTAELAWAMNVNMFGPRTSSGSLFLDLTGYHDAPPYGGVTQTLATTPDQSYRLSFSIGSHEGTSNYRGPMTVAATAGSVSNSFTFMGFGLVNQWGTFTMDFTADSATTPLTFTGTSSAGGAYLGLDDISVIPTSASGALKIESISVAGAELRIHFASAGGIRYALESRDDLSTGEWLPVPGSERTASGGNLVLAVTVNPTQPHRFFRLIELR